MKNNGFIILATPFVLAFGVLIGLLALGSLQYELLQRNSILFACLTMNFFMLGGIIALIRNVQISHWIGSIGSFLLLVITGYFQIQIGGGFSEGFDTLIYRILVGAIIFVGMLLAATLGGKGSKVNDYKLFDETQRIRSQRTPDFEEPKAQNQRPAFTKWQQGDKPRF